MTRIKVRLRNNRNLIYDSVRTLFRYAKSAGAGPNPVGCLLSRQASRCRDLVLSDDISAFLTQVPFLFKKGKKTCQLGNF